MASPKRGKSWVDSAKNLRAEGMKLLNDQRWVDDPNDSNTMMLELNFDNNERFKQAHEVAQTMADALNNLPGTLNVIVRRAQSTLSPNAETSSPINIPLDLHASVTAHPLQKKLILQFPKPLVDIFKTTAAVLENSGIMEYNQSQDRSAA